MKSFELLMSFTFQSFSKWRIARCTFIRFGSDYRFLGEFGDFCGFVWIQLIKRAGAELNRGRLTQIGKSGKMRGEESLVQSMGANER
ncbi:hypothetical protein [Paenibacillus validus]|uniref:hypothetical protein n=1 Tax=Paenibacillus validus TaxID=44253 RepID=UPI003D2AA0AD